MPSLRDALTRDRSNLAPVAPAVPENKPPATEDQAVKSLLKSAYQRCPLPPSSNSADSLRQFGQSNQVPVFRTQTPPSNITGATKGSTTTNVIIEGGSGSTTFVNTAYALQNASVTTPPLSPGQSYQTTIQLAKSFRPLSVSCNVPCRVELYGSAIAQALDSGRPAGQTPPNTIQGLLSDVSLLGSPLTWNYLSTIGSNQSTPMQTTTIWITLTNNSMGVTAVTASISFVGLQS